MAAVVLGPGSIVTSSRVGASWGLVGIPVVCVATGLMIAMVILAARVGMSFQNSPCEELSVRLGRPVAVGIGGTLFTLVALFQSSNNVAIIGGLEPLLQSDGILSPRSRVLLLLAVNSVVIAILYMARNLYRLIEGLMKLLIGLMTVTFLMNFVQVIRDSPGRLRASAGLPESPELLPLLGMVGTTFSVAGAFYQAYLVRERRLTVDDVQQVKTDAIASIGLLGLLTMIILITSAAAFFPDGDQLSDIGAVAGQLELTFGTIGKQIFCAGILAGALSSFLVNAMIGGTVLSDSLGRGSQISDRWPLHFTTAALLSGMCVAIASVLGGSESTVHLITFAQALTVPGMPVLAAALLYLGFQSAQRIPLWLLTAAVLGFLVSWLLAGLTATHVYRHVVESGSG